MTRSTQKLSKLVLARVIRVVTLGVLLAGFGVGAALAQNRGYVTNFNGNSVSVIDTATHTVIATVTVGLSPVGVAVTPNGAFVYVTNGGDNNVSVINAATNT